jgi:hypothetical protein
MKNSVTLKKAGYLITGVSDLTMWGGGNGCINMQPFKVQKATKKELQANINDNRFGVENINGAICDIHILYEHGYKEYLKTVTVGKVSEHTEKYYYNN